MPPSTAANFNDPYPLGFEGTSLLCSLSFGTHSPSVRMFRKPGLPSDKRDALRHQSVRRVRLRVGQMDYDGLRHCLVLLLFTPKSKELTVASSPRWFIFTFVSYLGLRFIRHRPAGKQRMKPVQITEEADKEMREFNIKAVKQRLSHPSLESTASKMQAAAIQYN